MKINLKSLDSLDVEALKAIIVKQDKELSAAKIALRNAALKIKILILKALGINLERRILPLPEMIDMFEDAGIEVANANNSCVTETQNTPKPRKPRKPEENRQELPPELPRIVKVLEVPDEDKVCPVTGKPLRLLGVAVTEVLEIEQPKFYVTRYERPQYVCVDHPEEGVTSMTLPKRVIDKGIAGETLLSYILTSKFIDHNPLERICKALERSGVSLSRKTLSDWVIACGRVLEPMRLALQRKILDSRIVNADETTYKVLQNHNKGKPINGYLWGYVGDRKYLLFEWNDGRSGSHPLSFLAGASCEWLQTDAYSGYNPVLSSYPNILAAGCWAHVRRKFAEAEKVGEIAAKHYLDFIAKMYAIEKVARDKDDSEEQLLKARKSQTVTILNELVLFVRDDKKNHTPKSPMGKAIAYLMNHWTALTSFVTDGGLEMDNNIIERAIRPVALGRKNWLFSGSETGANTAALVISLVGTCTLCNVEPSKYLRNLLRILPNFTGSDYAELLPDAFSSMLDKLEEKP